MKQMKTKKERGITLIALVVTIITLIVLAGVSINLVFGENGVVVKAKKSKEEQKIATAKEKIELEISGAIIEKKGDMKPEDLILIDNKNGIKIKKVEGTNNIEVLDNKVTAYVDGYEFIIYKNKVYYVGEDGNFNPTEKPEEKPKEYIKDGLVLWYDGVNNTREGHKENSTIWENIAPLAEGEEEGKYDGTLMKVNGDATSGWTNNSLILDGIDDWVKMPYIYNENMTIEIVVKNLDLDVGKIQNYITNKDSGGVTLENKNGKNTGEVYIGDNYKIISSNNRLKINQIYSLSLSYDGIKEYFRENEKTYTKDIDGIIKQPNYNTIFAIGTNPYKTSEFLNNNEERSNIEVFSVRIYNRCLTQEERENNYEVDLEKYKLEEVENVPTASELGYVSNGLVTLYDGKYNTLSGESKRTTIWEDLSGNSNNGTLNNFNFTNKSGWNNNALLLDGIDDWVKMQYLYNSNMTVEIVTELVKNEAGKATNIICNYEDGGIGITNNGTGNNKGQIYIGSSYIQAISTSKISCNKKYSLSVRNNNLGVIFRENNDKYINETIKSGKIVQPNYSTVFAIGTNPRGVTESISSNTNRLNGYVYSVRIYNRALTEEEIQQNYNVDKLRYNIN